MKSIKKLILLNIILIIISSCTSMKKDLTKQKKKSTDEFFIQKKTPLVMPPSYGELPLPTSKENLKNSKNDVEIMIKNSKDQKLQTNNSSNQNKTLEKSILGKIKNN